jgi:3-oxoacyl-[acyl-carrier protein] reductase
MAKPEDIASIIVFLASDESRFMTGEVVHANGGLYMA